MTTTLLTAYNKDVQRYIQQGRRSGTKLKKTIMATIEESVIKSGISFESLFPSKTKRKAVMDEILFLLSGPGICKIESKTLAKKVDCSVRTVSDAVKNLKKTGQVLVCGLADGKNKYVFVLKSHPNFRSIMQEVFFMKNAEQIAGQIAEQKYAENVDSTELDVGNMRSNSINSINLKQERSFIQHSIENDIQVSEKDSTVTREKLVSYTANKHQLMLFDNIMDYPFPQEIKDKAGILALRVGMDSDVKRSIHAFQLLGKIASNMTSGVDIRNVVAVFTEGLDKPLDRYKDIKEKKSLEANKVLNIRKVKPVPFYNWLVERD